jgi:hypothetical protein
MGYGDEGKYKMVNNFHHFFLYYTCGAQQVRVITTSRPVPNWNMTQAINTCMHVSEDLSRCSVCYSGRRIAI